MHTDTRPTLAGATPTEVAAGSHCNTQQAGLVTSLVITHDQHVLARLRTEPPFAGTWELPTEQAKLEDPENHDQYSTAADQLFTRTTGHNADTSRETVLSSTENPTSDPRQLSTLNAATVYRVDKDTPAPEGMEWLLVEDLANGSHILAFTHAQHLAEATRPGGALPDPELHTAFTALAAAAEVRNAEIATRANAVRVAKGAAATHVNWARLSKAKDTLEKLHNDGLATAPLEDRTIPLAQRLPQAQLT